jgi:hypothetical protein
METYETYLEDLMEEAVKRLFGETYHIKSLRLLYHVVHKNANEKFDYLFAKIDKVIKQFCKNNLKCDAENIAHEFMKILRDNVCVNVNNILVNPSIFNEVNEEFKKNSFPHFCFGLIDCCECFVTHGYVIDSHIKYALKRCLNNKIRKSSSQPWKSEFCSKLLDFLDRSGGNVWSPGVFKEIEYALKIGKEVYCLQNETLIKVYNLNSLPDNDIVITLDKYGLYKEIWQPIARSVYRTLTEAIKLSELL